MRKTLTMRLITQKNTKGLVKIRMQKILKYASVEGVAYKIQAKSKCYQTANFESNSAQI